MPEPTLAPDAYRQLVEQSPVLTWRSDHTRARDYFNDRWLRWTGRTMEQELGPGWTEGVHPDDLEGYIAGSAAAIDAREPYETELRLLHVDGQYRWIFDRGVPYTGDGGTFAGYIGACIDIHDAVEGRAARTRVLELEMRRLTGLLPVCGSCKRVRDDVGYWQSVEQFVTAHTDAEFTYGYCPTCYESAMDALRAPESDKDAWVLPGI